MSSFLYHAVQSGRLKKVKLLVSQGLSANIPNELGQNPLVAALHIDDAQKRRKMFLYLCNNGGDCEAFDKSTKRDLFTWACFLDRTYESIWLLQDQNGNIDFRQKDKTGRTSLHYCAVNGNVSVLKKVVEYMKKYSISVDIMDVEGFTPFILALRTGHMECADILKQGGASPFQFDAKNLKSGEDWTWIWEREKSYFVRQANEKKVTMYKALGRLPALKAANFDAGNVKIVKSKVDNHLLSRKEVEIPERKSSDMFRQTTWLDFDKSRLKQLSRSLPNIHLDPILHHQMQIGNKENNARVATSPQSTNTGNTDVPKNNIGDTPNVKKVHFKDSSHVTKFRPALEQVKTQLLIELHPNWNTKTNQVDNMKRIMGMLGDQRTTAYRPTAKPPTPPPVVVIEPEKKRKKGAKVKEGKKTPRSGRGSAASTASDKSKKSSVFPTIKEESS